MAIRATYIGDGEFLNGIPARDLDEDTYQALSVEQRKDVRESGLYEVRTDVEMRELVRETRSAPARAPKVEDGDRPPVTDKTKEEERST